MHCIKVGLQRGHLHFALRKEEVFKRREEGLKKKDAELQDALVRFSKFLQVGSSRSSSMTPTGDC